MIEAERESRGNEHGYSFLSRREAKPLPHFTEFETPDLFNHEYKDEQPSHTVILSEAKNLGSNVDRSKTDDRDVSLRST